MGLPLVGAMMIPTNGRTKAVYPATIRYTRHEVTSR
jgi:hypothetical protein